MRTIYIVTHPEAAHHVDGLVGGWYDSLLTSSGHLVAAKIAESLKARIPNETNVELYTSDLQRTLQTAERIATVFNTQPIPDRRLREKSYGVAEGKPQAFLDESMIPAPRGVTQIERLMHVEGVEGAETKFQWAGRLYEALDSILESNCEHQIVVTHGGSLTFLIAAWIKMPLEHAGYASFRAPSGSITVLREDDFWHNRGVVSLGDVGHLRTANES